MSVEHPALIRAKEQRLSVSLAALTLGVASCLSLPPFSASPDEQLSADSGAFDGSNGRREDADGLPDAQAPQDTGAGTDAGTPDAMPDSDVARRYRVFVSSSSRVGALGGAVGADAECQRLGDMRPPAAKWRAFLWQGPNLVNAPENQLVVPANGFFLMPPVGLNPTLQVFAGMPGALSGTPLNPISTDEMGVFIGAVSVWIGKAEGSRCNEWTTGSSAFDTVAGTSNQTGAWRLTLDLNCASSAHLYCFEQ